MPQLRLTEKTVRTLKAPDPSGKQVLYWDDAMPGFGVLCSGTSTSKTYVVRGNVGGRDIRKKIERADLIALADARIRARQMMVDFSGGIDPRTKATNTTDVTLRAALDTYLNKRTLKPRSKKGMRDTIERHLAGWLDRPLFSITRDMVEQRHKDIAQEVEASHRVKAAEHAKLHLKRAERTEVGWPEASEQHRARYEAAKARNPNKGFATANGTMIALRALWNFMADRIEDAPRNNPVSRLKKQWFKVKRRGRLVKGDDMSRFYTAVTALENPIARDYILLTLFTGLRRNEAASLKWKDIDFTSRVIRIAETKANYDVDLPMSDFVHDLLEARRAIGKTEYVFPAGSASGHLAEPKFAFKLIADATGLRYSVHDMRRTFITNAELSSISPLAVKALVDHSLGTDVTAGYVKLTVEDLREPVQRVTSRLRDLCGVASR